MSTACVAPAVAGNRRAGLVSVSGDKFPLERVSLEGLAEAGVASTVLIQNYRNPYREPLEVVYTLPLPADGAVTGYEITIGDRIIRGEVAKREEAARQYREALLEGRTAALLEQERADTFTQQLGCVPAGQSVQVRIEVLHPLMYLSAEGEAPPRWEYRFPTVAGVRYEGAPGRVADSERLDVERAAGEGTPVRMRAALEIREGSIQEVLPAAPHHAILAEAVSGGVRVSLAEESKLDRDLVIRWTAAREGIGVRVVTGPGLPGDTGRYAVVTITPPDRPGARHLRDLTLLIDASGSMSGAPIETARGIAAALIRSLDESDRFEVVAFAGDVRYLVRGPVAASAGNVAAALDKLARLEAGGCTEMASAVEQALAPLRPDSQRQVILLTDGYIGFEADVIGRLVRHLTPGARLHAVGIGSAPNRALTRTAARAGKGVEVLAGDGADTEQAIGRLLRATVAPVLTEIEVSGSGVATVRPERPSDVFRDRPVVLFARLLPEGGEIEIRGRLANEAGAWVRRIGLAAAADSPPETRIPIGALFGREAIEDCETRLAACGPGETGGLEQEIEELGLRHRIASRRTSLVAVSESQDVDPRAPRRRERLPVELPADVSAEGVGLAPQPAMAMRLLCDTSFADSGFDFVVAEVDRMASAPARPGLRRRVQTAWRQTTYGEVEIGKGRVLSVAGRLLVVEFEVPADRFVLPADGEEVEVESRGRPASRARFIGAKSSPVGPHARGLTVRLALELVEGEEWARGETVVRWRKRGGVRRAWSRRTRAVLITAAAWPATGRQR